MKKAIKRVQSQARLNYAERSILCEAKRLRLGAVMLYALTIGLGLAFTLAGCYALSATGDIRHLPMTRLAIITVDLIPHSRHYRMVLLARN